MAGLIFLWIGYITWMAIKHYKEQKIVVRGWVIAFILVTLQVAAGAVVVFTSLNIYIALAHAFFITCLFGLLSYFIMLLTRGSMAFSTVPQTDGNAEIESTNIITQ